MAMNAEATRLGSRALLCNALASLFISIVGPFFVTGSRNTNPSEEIFQTEKATWKSKLHQLWKKRKTIDLAMLWAVSHGMFSVCMLSTLYELILYGIMLDIASYWHITSFIDSVTGATLILTVAGLCWAITQWAPFALVSPPGSLYNLS